MKTLNVSDVVRRFGQVLDEVEHEQEEIVLVRNRRQVARLVPELRQNALEVFGDLAGSLDEKTAEVLSKSIRTSRENRAARLNGLRNPWAS